MHQVAGTADRYDFLRNPVDTKGGTSTVLKKRILLHFFLKNLK